MRSTLGVARLQGNESLMRQQFAFAPPPTPAPADKAPTTTVSFGASSPSAAAGDKKTEKKGEPATAAAAADKEDKVGTGVANALNSIADSLLPCRFAVGGFAGADRPVLPGVHCVGRVRTVLAAQKVSGNGVASWQSGVSLRAPDRCCHFTPHAERSRSAWMP